MPCAESEDTVHHVTINPCAVPPRRDLSLFYCRSVLRRSEVDVLSTLTLQERNTFRKQVRSRRNRLSELVTRTVHGVGRGFQAQRLPNATPTYTPYAWCSPHARRSSKWSWLPT